jgi:hypothetical protein
MGHGTKIKNFSRRSEAFYGKFFLPLLGLEEA